jgi:hypothetical protein
MKWWPLIFTTFAGFFLVGCKADYKELIPYSGSKLSSLTWTCRSSRVTAAGYWRDIHKNSIDAGSMISSESEMSTWRISVKDNVGAEVTRYSGASQTVEKTQVFSAAFTSGGIQLISQHSPSESPEVITIDLGSSSFVYSTQHVNPLWNRVNVFLGTCSPSL